VARRERPPVVAVVLDEGPLDVRAAEVQAEMSSAVLGLHHANQYRQAGWRGPGVASVDDGRA